MKTCQFYEFILVDTDLVEITHNTNKNNPQRIASSKCQILRVMTLIDWNQKPFTCKAFSQTFHPMSYNYIDYMNAWYNMLYLQSYHIHGLFKFQEATTPNFQLGLKNGGLSWYTRLHIFF